MDTEGCGHTLQLQLFTNTQQTQPRITKSCLNRMFLGSCILNGTEKRSNPCHKNYTIDAHAISYR